MTAPTQMQSVDAIAELARIWKRYEGDPDGAIRAITETAAKALKTALAAPARPGRELADAGRRGEIQKLLGAVNAKLRS